MSELSSHVEARRAEQDAHVGQMRQELVQAWVGGNHDASDEPNSLRERAETMQIKREAAESKARVAGRRAEA